jgi:hypothetical protein
MDSPNTSSILRRMFGWRVRPISSDPVMPAPAAVVHPQMQECTGKQSGGDQGEPRVFEEDPHRRRYRRQELIGSGDSFGVEHPTLNIQRPTSNEGLTLRALMGRERSRELL